MRKIALAVPFLYAGLRFGLAAKLGALGTYGPEIFDLIFTVMVLFTYRKRLTLRFRVDLAWIIQAALALVLGFGVYRMAGGFGLTIPFDLSSRETLLMLLIFGPILEELLFRQALWLPVEYGIGSPVTALALTTLFFAAGHFQAYFEVPEQFKLFVIYQTIYVSFLGAWFGVIYFRAGSVLASLGAHFMFNLGFFLGSLSWI